ncbi:hypothetical protein D3C71_1303960 [compost metagenome]
MSKMVFPAGHGECRSILAVSQAIHRQGLNQRTLRNEPFDLVADLVRACETDRAAQRRGSEQALTDHGLALGQVVDGVLHNGLRRGETGRQALRGHTAACRVAATRTGAWLVRPAV